MIAHTLQAWATGAGMDRRTLESKLVKLGFNPKPHQKIPFNIIHAALTGDKQAEEVRALRLDNAERERKAKVEKRKLVSMEEADKLFTEFLLQPLSQRLNDARATGKVPSEWIDETMKIITDGVPKNAI